MVNLNLTSSMIITQTRKSLIDYIKTLSDFFGKEGFTASEILEAKLKQSNYNYFLYNTSGNIRTNTVYTLETLSNEFNIRPVLYDRATFSIIDRVYPTPHVLVVSPSIKEGVKFLCLWSK